MKYMFEIPNELFVEVNDIVEELGLDMNNAIKMFFKRIAKEGSISFLLSKPVERTVENISNVRAFENRPSVSEVEEKVQMTKSMAVRLFREKGHVISKNVTFSSKNRAVNNYWANPNYSVLEMDWHLILNDWSGRKLYLFTIPAKKISANQLVHRNDKPELIDLQIAYRDTSFTDNRSDYCFKPFLVDCIDY